MAELEAEQDKREGEVRVFASNAESELAQSDYLLRRQQQNSDEQYLGEEKPEVNIGEDDRGRRRLVKEEERHRLYIPPVRMQIAPTVTQEPSSGSGHPTMAPSDVGNFTAPSLGGMDSGNQTRRIPNAKIAPIPTFADL